MPTPHEIYDELSAYVAGREDAKPGHVGGRVQPPYRRVIEGGAAVPAFDDGPDSQLDSDMDEVRARQVNILLLGPTVPVRPCSPDACAHPRVPFAIAKTPPRSPGGRLCGARTWNILLKLINAADGDMRRARSGHYLRGRDRQDRPQGRKPLHHPRCFGRGVQQALLKILEGHGGQRFRPPAAVSIPSRGCCRSTTNILFICGGAFVRSGQDHRRSRGQQGRGLLLRDRRPHLGRRERPAASGAPQDLNAFGMIPEFVGRLPVVTQTRRRSTETTWCRF